MKGVLVVEVCSGVFRCVQVCPGVFRCVQCSINHYCCCACQLVPRPVETAVIQLTGMLMTSCVRSTDVTVFNNQVLTRGE